MKSQNSAKGGQKQVRGVYRFRAQNRRLSAGMILLAGLSLSVSAVDAGIVLVPAPGNTATGNRSVVVTGLSNTASGNGSFIGSGVSHTASGFSSAILSGQSNTASGSLSSVVGGKLNLATAEGSFVGGGLQNQSTGIRSGVLGGYVNKATGLESGVVGGRVNIADGDYATVAGGIFNTATGPGSIVGGGSTNKALGGRSGVFAGKFNVASGTNSIVLGGEEGTAAGKGSLVHGTSVSDGGFRGNVILADTDPFNVRLDTLFTSDTPDQFITIFANGHKIIGENGVVSDNPALEICDFETGFEFSIAIDGDDIQAKDDESGDGYGDLYLNYYGGNVDIAAGGGNVEIGSASSTTTINGTFVNASDRNIKEAIKPVSGKEVLERLVEMPVSTWRYKGGERGHIGPMAQDFHAAFNDLLDLNSDDKTIAPLDEAGIAFTSIQALHEIVQEKDAEIDALREEKDAEIGALKEEQKALNERLEKLEALLSSEAR